MTEQTIVKDGVKHRVLLVEDDLSQARLVSLIFEHSELPVELHLAHSLAEANTVLDSSTFDLVITDLNLPDGLGIELLPDDPSRMAFPVVLLTGQGDEEVAVQAIKSGAFDYIVKTDSSIKALPNTAAKVIREWGNVLLRREMEEALRQKQSELEAKHLELQQLFKQVSQGKREWELTIDRVNDLIIRTDKDGCVRRVNRAVLELTGLSYQELNGIDISEIFDGLSVNNPDCNNVEMRHGSSGRVFMVSSYLLDDVEIGAGMVVAAHEYTSISALNKQLSDTNQELGKKSSELEAAYETLTQTKDKVVQQEKMATVGQLAAGVAHEINNPMGFISSNLGTLGKYLTRLKSYLEFQDSLFPEINCPEKMALIAEKKQELGIDFILGDLSDLVAESLDGAERVRKIVSDLKGFSHQSKEDDEPTDLNRLLESTIPIVWNEIKYKAVLNREFTQIPQVSCRHRLLGQVIINLLVNAVQSIDKQGVITIKTWHEDDLVNLSISDTGSGIPPEVVKRIFDPFFTTKEVGVGTGLGLSISYDIVKQHGGELKVDSVLGEGSTFTISLPVIQDGDTATKGSGDEITQTLDRQEPLSQE